MARHLKQMNYAEHKIVVGALEVIGNVTGPGMKTIRKSIDSLSGNIASINTEINNYWSDIANDAVITPGEKKDLRKEFNTIERTHAAILSAAEDEGLLLAEEIQSYRRKYDELYDYIFNKLRLFDDPSTNTEIPDTEYFEQIFNNYYVAEILAQNRLAAGLAAATVRTLSNLDQVGMDGEVAIYNGAFYEYSLNEHKWILIDTNAIYLGPVEEEPVNAVIGSFFLAINDGVKLVRRLCARVRENDFARTVIANGKKVLAAIRNLPAGTIYLKTSAGWIPVTNVNDWRYMVAMNDLLKYGYAIPEYVDEHIKSNSGKDYHGAILALEEPEIPTKGYRWADLDNGKSYYYNGLQWEISNFKNKDYFCWGGAHNTEYKALSLKRGYIYKLDNGEWRELIPEVASEVGGVSRLNNQEEFMAALTDILKLNASGPGYFTTVFASAFFGNNASIESLQTKTIELSEEGLIKSKDFISGADTGFIQRADGSFELQGGTVTVLSVKKIHFNHKYGPSETGFSDGDMWMVE